MIFQVFQFILNAGIVFAMLAFCLFMLMCMAAAVKITLDAVKWMFR